MIDSSNVKATLFVTGIAGIAAALISMSHEFSRERITENQRTRLLMRLEAVLGDVVYDNELERSRRRVVAPDLLGTNELVDVYIATYDEEPVAAVIASVAPNGYNGSIALLVGVASDGRLTGVRTTQHRETPGLGDAIEIAKSRWIEQFVGRSLADPVAADWRVSRDGGEFDSITGATVTPRAVIEAVRNTLLYFRDHRQELFDGLERESASAAP